MDIERLKGLRVAIIVTDDFEQIEMVDPRKLLVAAGADTTLIAPKPGVVQGMKHDDKADTFDVEMLLAEADPEEFDALLLPGGALNSDALRVEQKAQEFVRSFDRAGKPMAVICHAPWLLVSSGIVKGRTLTSYHTIQDDIRNAGGDWVDRSAVRDRNLVTSRKPADLDAFDTAMADLFEESMRGAAKEGAPAGR
ncbi:MAG TPA: type 1 glutamine amidotransferase domain-containing protein [Candidatus Limnocylindria bacterium]